jgi:hypothetical protein
MAPAATAAAKAASTCRRLSTLQASVIPDHTAGDGMVAAAPKGDISVESQMYEWPREATDMNAATLEQWLAGHGWEIDPTVFMAGARGPAVQVRRIGAAWQDGEPGLLILPGEMVEYDGAQMRTVVRPVTAASVAT